MKEENKKNRKKIDVFDGNVISKKNKNAVFLALTVVFIAIISGVLGAFNNGQFQRTYDFVSVNLEISEVDYNDPIFSDLKKDSKVTIITKELEKYDIETGQNYTEEIEIYSGYYKEYFFSSTWFYAETILNTSMVIMFYTALVNFLISKREEDDPVYLQLSKDINEITVVENSLPSSSFEPYMENWNTERKIRQHERNVKYKIARLEQKTSFKIRKAFYEYKMINGKKVISFKIPEKMSRKEKKYFDKKSKLESFLEEDYISRNVPFDKVKRFKWIYPSFVNSGNNSAQKSTDEYSNIRSNVSKYSKDLFHKVLMGFSITSLVTSVLSFTLIKTNDHWIIIVYSVLLKMLPLIIQAFMAIDYSNKFMESQAIPNIKKRLNIASNFLVEKENIEEKRNKTIKELIREKEELEESLKKSKDKDLVLKGAS